MGILSRAVQTGFLLWDKYLGDALYAAMVYEFVRLVWNPRHVTGWAMAAMIAIEAFQLTGIAKGMVATGTLPVRIAGRLLGTHFSVVDLCAYAVGIACMWMLDARRATSGTEP